MAFILHQLNHLSNTNNRRDRQLFLLEYNKKVSDHNAILVKLQQAHVEQKVYVDQTLIIMFFCNSLIKDIVIQIKTRE